MARSDPNQLALMQLDLSEVDLAHFKSFQESELYTSYCKHFIAIHRSIAIQEASSC